jgi:hypothetical protein
MTPDTATRAAEALKRAFCIERLVDDPEYPGEDEWIFADKEEIASILRPFMETQEDPRMIKIAPDTYSKLIEAFANLSGETQRKDKEIAQLQGEIASMQIRKHEDSLGMEPL